MFTRPHGPILSHPEVLVPHIVALLIFVALSAANWYVAVACFRSTSGASAGPNDSAVAAGAIGAVTLTCFIPFPAGFVAGLVVWAVAAYGFLPLSAERATVLFGCLAAASVVSRLVVLGLLSTL